MVETRMLSELAALEKVASKFGRLADDYIVCQFSSVPGESPAPAQISSPFKVMGMAWCIVREGALTLEVNSETYSCGKGTFMAFHFHDVIRVRTIPGSAFVGDFVMISHKFVQDLNIDLSAINLHDLVENPPSPIFQLTAAEADTMCTFLKLLRMNACENTELVFAKNVARSLVQAMLYQLLQIRSNHEKRVVDTEAATNRKRQYVQEFMRLLQIHHSAQRSISFYAERLCISAKYLSHLVKEATGRSAAEWVADLVVQEAKNMLRYSNKNVQQVAYALNFATQSSFGKYFKHVTGMSPSDYQKS